GLEKLRYFRGELAQRVTRNERFSLKDRKANVFLKKLDEPRVRIVARERGEISRDALGPEGAVRLRAGHHEERIVDAAAGREAREAVAQLGAAAGFVDRLVDGGERGIDDLDDRLGPLRARSHHLHEARVAQLEDRARHLELELADPAADVRDRPLAVALRE